MYFWRIAARKDELKQRPMTDRQVLPYLIAYVALLSALGAMFVEDVNRWDLAGHAWTVFLAVAGTIYVYRRNGGASGEQFVQRYLAVGWVVGVRATPVIVPLLIVYWVTMFDVAFTGTTWIEAVGFGAVEAFLYWRVGHHVADVARGP